MKVSIVLLVGLGAFIGSCDRSYGNKSSSSPSGKVATLSIDLGKGSSPDVVHTASDFHSWDPKEIANDAEIQKYQEKGSWLGCLMDASDEAGGKMWPDPYARTPKSARSPWLGTLAELSIWGWHEGSYDAEINCDFSQDGTENYNHQAGGDNFCFSIEHFDEDAVDEDNDAVDYFDQKYTVKGRKYSATGAFFRFAINYVGGAIFAQNLESPRAAAVENWEFNPDDDMLPKLRLASDVMFPYWMRNNADPKKLRYYFVNTVANEVTQRLIARIVQKKGLPNLPKWPGITLGMWEREAEYLLGSPIGATIAFMLIQHKAELGRKHVTEIKAFLAPGNQVQLIFSITDVPRSEEDSSGSSINLQVREADENLHVHVSTSEINDGVEETVEKHMFTVARGKAKL